MLEEFMINYEVKVILIYEQYWEELPGWKLKPDLYA